MTEYKKLVISLNELRSEIGSIKELYNTHCNRKSDVDDKGSNNGNDVNFIDVHEMKSLNDTPTLSILDVHKQIVEIKVNVADIAHRLRKLVLKARENDPNKQIFNEIMCCKIEQLLTDFVTVIVNVQNTKIDLKNNEVELLEEEEYEEQEEEEEEKLEIDVINTLKEEIVHVEHFEWNAPELFSKLEDIYERELVTQASIDAFQHRIAHDLAELYKFEEHEREVMYAQESQEQKELLEHKYNDYNATLAQIRANELARWNKELQRRSVEHRELVEKASSLQTCEAIKEFILDKLLCSGLLLVQFAHHMYNLANAIIKHPEDVYIRTLRNNNENLITEFGHPTLRRVWNDYDEMETRTCMCERVINTAEVVWYLMGYELRYSRQGIASVAFLVKEGVLHDAILPCGAWIHEHDAIEIGYESYSERSFELQEPDAVTESDKWLSWYERVQMLKQIFSDLMKKTEQHLNKTLEEEKWKEDIKRFFK